jgi:hypothetical protein
MKAVNRQISNISVLTADKTLSGSLSLSGSLGTAPSI